MFNYDKKQRSNYTPLQIQKEFHFELLYLCLFIENDFT